METVETYSFGATDIPLWVRTQIKDPIYTDNKLSRATIITMHGPRPAKLGDVLMRIHGGVIIVSEKHAKKYGITRK